MMPTRTRALRVAAASCLVLVAMSACSGTATKSVYGPGDPNLAATNPAGGPIDPFLTDGHAVLRALDAIAARAGRPLRATAISADQMNGLIVEVQEPQRRARVDRYVVAPNGTLSGPHRVKLSSQSGRAFTATDIDRRVFDPTVIGWLRL